MNPYQKITSASHLWNATTSSVLIQNLMYQGKQYADCPNASWKSSHTSSYLQKIVPRPKSEKCSKPNPAKVRVPRNAMATRKGTQVTRQACAVGSPIRAPLPCEAGSTSFSSQKASKVHTWFHVREVQISYTTLLDLCSVIHVECSHWFQSVCTFVSTEYC